MSEYKVEVAGVVVWSDSVDGPPHPDHFPAEWLERPAEPGEGQSYPPAHVLSIDGEIVGVQISLTEEIAVAARAQFPPPVAP